MLRGGLVFLGVVVALTACNGDAGEKSTRAEGSEAVSRPLTYAQVTRVGENTPAGAVLKLWFWAQWGSAPNVVAMYDRRVVQSLGARNISGVYSWLRGTLVELRPRIVGDIRARRNRAFIAVEARAAGSDPARYAFLLRRTGEGWVVIHDTLLQDSLPQYVAFKIDGQTRGNPSRRARVEGERLAERYRDLFPDTNARVPSTARSGR
jgi:hypothetical protein